MVTRKEIYMRPRKDRRLFIRTAYHYILLFGLLGIVTYVGYEFLARSGSSFYNLYSNNSFFYSYNIALFMILNLIFLFSVVKRGVAKTFALVGISALSFIAFNLVSPLIAGLIFKNLQPSILNFILNFKSSDLTAFNPKLFNYIPVFLSLVMWALLTLLLQPFYKLNSLKRDRKANLVAMKNEQ
ncbi:MAG: hypothetical protein FWC47_02920 [Oscillospiraceae bacterium]|nr:hypothetical protein [Oscillospiraceae bacterium]